MTTRFEDIPALLDGLARLPPERPALTFYKGKTRAGHWTYGELRGAVERFARRLRDELGVRQGDRVAVLAPNRLEVPALFLAAMRLGAAVVPLNPTTPPADWDYILAHSEARLIFGARELLDRLVTRPDVVCAFEDEPVPGDVDSGAAPTRAVAATAAAELAGEADGDRPLHLGNHRQPERGRARSGQPPRQRLEHGAQLSASKTRRSSRCCRSTTRTRWASAS